MIADQIDKATQQILERTAAMLDDARCHELARAAIAQLIAQLRTPQAFHPVMSGTAIGVDAFVRTLNVVQTCVLDAVPASAVDVRTVMEWFIAATQHALGANNRRLVEMLDALEDKVILLDDQARVVFLNRASESAARGMHNVSREEMIGRRAIEPTHSSAYDTYTANMIRRALSGEIVGGEFLLPLPDGAVWHEHQFHPMRGVHGTVEAVAVSSRDIDARRQAENRLRLLSKIALLAQSNQLDDVLAQAAGLVIPELADWAVFELVRDGAIERSTIVHPKASGASLPQRRVVIAERARLIDLADVQRDPALISLLQTLGATTAITVPFVVMGAPIAIATFVFGPESGRRHTDGDLPIADEVARRAGQIVENARLHGELAEALAYRERVMGILGHDLRNPVAAVLSLSSTLERRADVPDRTKEGLRHIQTAAARMNQMITTILDFTRLRFHGRLELARENIELVAIAHSIVDELRATHPGRELVVTASEDSRGRWDASRMGQVISNLVANALTHGARDSPVHVMLSGDAASVVLAVTNQGPPIPAHVIGKLFEPFWQADSARSRGLGLGLLIAQQIVHAHGGEIAVESQSSGTTFTVRVPRS